MAIAGVSGFGNLSFTINGSELLHGDFVNALITFVSVAAAVSFLIVLPDEKFNEAGELRHPAVPGVRDRDPGRRHPLSELHREVRGSPRRLNGRRKVHAGSEAPGPTLPMPRRR